MLYVAVVHGVNAVLLVAAARTRAALAGRLGEYIRRHADDRLWPGDAGEVHRLLAAGEHEAAVDRYFTAVGERWDEEWLATEVIQVEPALAS